MRKLQQIVIVAAAAGGLTAVGAGAGTAFAGDKGHGPKVKELYRPYQECSPQTFAESNLPIGVLAVPQTWGTTCGQFNHAFTG
ncbi:hypothetical protein [Streptomyces halobius]|uniref:Uncharacterized protein n=1 Tax=Streptomyces halobius TaxID=2879846 RepID=A0ABY4MCB2_9ACTN|nr:hypothetical protein [Streptomyces halobius]UQA95032.1 hypothetical protein K9S39_27085 [Streptomyces halobius]